MRAEPLVIFQYFYLTIRTNTCKIPTLANRVTSIKLRLITNVGVNIWIILYV